MLMNMFTLDMLMLGNGLAVATPNDMSGSHASADLCSCTHRAQEKG